VQRNKKWREVLMNSLAIRFRRTMLSTLRPLAGLAFYTHAGAGSLLSYASFALPLIPAIGVSAKESRIASRCIERNRGKRSMVQAVRSQPHGLSSTTSSGPRRLSGARHQIFVQIPAYRDRELGATLIDLYGNATAPERLRVSVLWQRSRDEILPEGVKKLPHLELIDVPFTNSRGCNWARSQVQKRWNGEKYTMLIDSHHRFVRDWDESLIGMHSGLLANGIRRPMITAYLPRYDPLMEPSGRQLCPYKIYPKGYEQGLLIHLTSHPVRNWTELKSPVPARFASGHFIFAAGDFNHSVRMDPGLYFTGDEVAISLRAHTHGYDLFHPHMVIGWHCYDRTSRIPHWIDHSKWWQRHEVSLSRLRRLFSRKLPGPFGLGTERTIESFEDRLLLPLIEDA
jgi:hypothetical protein